LIWNPEKVYLSTFLQFGHKIADKKAQQQQEADHDDTRHRDLLEKHLHFHDLSVLGEYDHQQNQQD
jgi:hypothetical protein